MSIKNPHTQQKSKLSPLNHKQQAVHHHHKSNQTDPNQQETQIPHTIQTHTPINTTIKQGGKFTKSSKNHKKNHTFKLKIKSLL